MIESFKSCYEGAQKEIIINKSKFIVTVSPVSTEEEAIVFIESVRKKYRDANHNCYAYVVGKQDEIRRCSDDGEPAKTAGVPMLDVILLEKIHNIAVVVTRYFGGVLLGTGGLVRAYQSSCKEGINSSIIIEKNYGQVLQILTDYNSIGKLQYLIANHGLITKDTTFTDTVAITIIGASQIIDKFRVEALEATSGKIIVTFLDPVYYASLHGEVIIFDS